MGAWRTYSRGHRYLCRLPGVDSVRHRIQHLRAPMSTRQTPTEASLGRSSFSRYDTFNKQRRRLQYTCMQLHFDISSLIADAGAMAALYYSVCTPLHSC